MSQCFPQTVQTKTDEDSLNLRAVPPAPLLLSWCCDCLQLSALPVPVWQEKDAPRGSPRTVIASTAAQRSSMLCCSSCKVETSGQMWAQWPLEAEVSQQQCAVASHLALTHTFTHTSSHVCLHHSTRCRRDGAPSSGHGGGAVTYRNRHSLWSNREATVTVSWVLLDS